MRRSHSYSSFLAAFVVTCGWAAGCGSEFSATDVGPGSDASIDGAQGGSSGHAGASTGGAAGASGTSGAAGSSGAGATGGTGGAAGAAGTAGSAGTGGKECDPGSTCVEPPGGDWSVWSWVGFMMSELSTSCPGVTTGATYYDEVGQPSPGPSQCSCVCIGQGGCTSAITCGSDAMCSKLLSFPGNAGPTCSELGLTVVNTYCKASIAQASIKCDVASSLSIPVANWTRNARTCMSHTSTSQCGKQGTCMPEVTGVHGLCIAATGNINCPSGSIYKARTLLYDAVADTRGCDFSTCECGGTSTPCACGAGGCKVEVRAAGCASLTSVEMPTDSSCVHMPAAGSTGFGVTLLNATPPDNLTCPLSGQAIPTGTLHGDSPITVCCQN